MNFRSSISYLTVSLKQSLISASLILCVACNKQPTAAFETDKSDYTAGDLVKITNNSTEGKKFEWSFPGGKSSNEETPEYTLPQTLAGGNYDIKLKALSKNGKKTSDASKTISVKVAQGRMVIWNSSKLLDTLNVSVDGAAAKKYIFMAWGTYPGCDAPGCALFNLNAGIHSVSITGKGKTFSGNVTVNRDDCSGFQIQ